MKYVLGQRPPARIADEDLEDLSEGKNYTPDFSSRKEPVTAVTATTSASSDEDDALSYFQKLAEE